MRNYREYIDRALDLKEAGKREESIAMLTDVIDVIPKSDIKALVLVGSLFRQSNDLPRALYCFQTATREDPSSASASVGLFHSLWRSETYAEAFDEMQRFFLRSTKPGKTKGFEDEEYSMLLQEMSEAYFDEDEDKPSDPLMLIKALRQVIVEE